MTRRLFGRGDKLYPSDGTEGRTSRQGEDGDGTFWALRDVSFEVQAGEILGIIGRNGAGKSTLLKILSQITASTCGRVVLNGRVASLLEVGTGFHPELTGRENVFLNGAILGMTKAEIRRKFDEIVAFAEVEEFIDTPVKRFSSGMYVRLAFAVAAHLDPEILVVDEVLAVGDLSFQQKCLGRMDEVARHGRTVLIVSHSIPLIERLCTRAILLRAGRIVSQGGPNEVIRSYLETGGAESLTWQRRGATLGSSHIRSVRLCQADGSEMQRVTCSDVPVLEVECVLSEGRPDAELAFALHDAQERPIFASSPNDVGVPFPTEKGLYRYRASFPGPVLMPQRYSVTVSLYSRYGEGIDSIAHALSFSVTETASGMHAGDHSRYGVLQLRCSWQRECFRDDTVSR
jgi:lipopolysaccharide transport system ATP-binding protein